MDINPDIIIEMEPGANGTFEAIRTTKQKKRKAPKVARPKPRKKNRTSQESRASNATRAEKHVPVKVSVPQNPLSEMQEGFKAGLSIVKSVRDFARMLR